jgi:hypothetical protein
MALCGVLGKALAQIQTQAQFILCSSHCCLQEYNYVALLQNIEAPRERGNICIYIFFFHLVAFSDVLERILKFPASVNLYMFHGGTNFGFHNGANVRDQFPHYAADVTSYGKHRTTYMRSC